MEKFDQKISEMLQAKAQKVEITDRMKNRIDVEVERRLLEKQGKRFSMKKVVILAAAACMLLGAGVFASGKVAGLVSGFDLKTLHSKTADFQELSKEEAILGYEVQAVPGFSNGFSFQEMDVEKTFGLDEDGNILKQYAYYELSMLYAKGDTKVYVNVCKPLEQNAKRTPQAVKSIGNTQVSFYEDTYKWVPEDYEPTAEDERNMEKEGYFISEGGDQAAYEEKVQHVDWVKNGIYYNIMGYSLPLGSEELFEMAEEIMNSTL